MVKGCHSKIAICGILTKTQSPGVKLNLAGFWMTRPVTLDGRTIPAVTRVLPRFPVLTETSLEKCSFSQLDMNFKHEKIVSFRGRGGAMGGVFKTITSTMESQDRCYINSEVGTKGPLKVQNCPRRLKMNFILKDV